jgi:hypothetical protein
MPCLRKNALAAGLQRFRLRREEPLRRLVRPRRHPYLGADRLGQPRCETHVVGVIVRDEHAPQRSARKDRIVERRPRRATDIVRHPRVDDGPAAAVLEQPDVDVVQLHRQRHAQPPEPVRDLATVPGLGWIAGQVIEVARRRRQPLALARETAATLVMRSPPRCGDGAAPPTSRRKPQPCRSRSARARAGCRASWRQSVARHERARQHAGFELRDPRDHAPVVLDRA